jgi:hypothetical protein
VDYLPGREHRGQQGPIMSRKVEIEFSMQTDDPSIAKGKALIQAAGYFRCPTSKVRAELSSGAPLARRMEGSTIMWSFDVTASYPWTEGEGS